MDTLPGGALRLIWDRLEDDWSRALFLHRMAFFFDGDFKHIAAMIIESVKRVKGTPEYTPLGPGIATFDEFYEADTDAPVAIYGAGVVGRSILPFLRWKGVDVLCFCDGDPKKRGTAYENTPIVAPGELRRHADPLIIIAMYSHESAQEAYDSLVAGGYPATRIVYAPPLNRREYFQPDFYTPGPDEVYFDVGVFNCGTIRNFLRFCGGRYKKIYAFEPDPQAFQAVAEEVKGWNLPNIEILNEGAWSSREKLTLSQAPRGGSSIQEKGGTAISVMPLDELNEQPTFIKLDVEGAELEALRGARESIRRCRPRLAVCLYHKKNDIVDIPSYVLDLVPEYRLHIRHHWYSHQDTVLYASI